MTGKYELTSIKIHPTVLAHGADVVAQVVLSAYRDAKQKADELIDKVLFYDLEKAKSIVGDVPVIK